MDYSNVSILVLSCDLYESVWNPYFRLLQKNWSEHPTQVYLLTEEKDYRCDFMNVKTIRAGKERTWSERLKFALSQIPSEYVLYTLEDYFIHEQVNNDGFQDAFDLMKRNAKWGGIWFHPIRRDRTYPIVYDHRKAFLKTNRLHKGRTNMMVILYRKAFLEKLIVKPENAWAFESKSNIRSIVAGYDVIHYRINDSAPVFLYYNKFVDGVGITSRKWLSRTPEIFEMNGITDVHYEELGILESRFGYTDPTDKRTDKKQQKYSIRDLIYYYITRPIKQSTVGRLLRAAGYWWKYYRKKN